MENGNLYGSITIKEICNELLIRQNRNKARTNRIT